MHRKKKAITSLKQAANEELNSENAVSVNGNSIFLSNTEMLNAVNNLQKQNTNADNEITNLLIATNKQLRNVRKGSEEEYCLLYTKNELLNLNGLHDLEMGNAKAKTDWEEPKVTETAKKQIEPIVVVEPELLEALNLKSIPTEPEINVKPLPTLNNNKELKFLRDENKKLRRDVIKYQDLAKRQGYSIIRDTVKVMIEKPVIEYVEKVVEKPVIQYVDKVVEKVIERPTIIEKTNTITNTVTKVEQLITLPPDVILFDIGKHNIKPQYNKRLSYYATQLKKYADLKVTLTGHTDATGNPEANRLLSERRATATKDYLLKQGVQEAQIETAFNGANLPTEENKSAAGKAQNRRVEIQFNK